VAAPTKAIATPHAKKLAKQHRVDISKVVGTGLNGRITAADVEAAAGIQPKPKAAPPPPPAAHSAPPAGAVRQPAVLPPVPGATVVPFTSMQAAVSRNMVESLSVPTFRVGYAIITDKLDALYEKVPLLRNFDEILNCIAEFSSCCSGFHACGDNLIKMDWIG
jgi:pyruvate dehydrogenase E2 component (dihydrolipoamide acetyltransferase)